MKDYILNETPLRTSEHFNINDIKVKFIWARSICYRPR